MHYLRFNDPGRPLGEKEKKRYRRREKLWQSILFFIPNANPDYGSLMYDVVVWLVEIDSTDNLPVREIALDKNGNTLFITPWRKKICLDG